MTKNRHRGSSFDDFLKEEGIREEVQARHQLRQSAVSVHAACAGLGTDVTYTDEELAAVRAELVAAGIEDGDA